MCEACAAGVQGFALGASLIVAIGAQNVFVLRQALLGRHVLPVVLFCAFADAALATLGAVGLGAAVRGSETALRVIAFGGAAFLFWYGLKAIGRALDPGRLEAANGGAASLREALTTVAAVTLLNPHVYLDTVVLVGGISASYPPPLQAWFIAGVVAASFAWFFTLGYGGRALAPLFRNPAAWRVFDIGVAAIMWLIAARLTVLGVSPQAF
jgi:L-lysine exporter family protein LysE/ArgO